MISILPHILIPMILANVLHIVIIKKNALPQLTIPVWKSQFGANKTWRGFIVLPVLNGLFFAMTNAFLPVFGGMQAIEIGAILGFTYMLFELPNSWIKRKMGIASGQKAKHHAWLFMLMDKMDSSFGVSLVCYFLLDWQILETVIFFGFAVATHVFFSWLLVFLKLKKRF